MVIDEAVEVLLTIDEMVEEYGRYGIPALTDLIKGFQTRHQRLMAVANRMSACLHNGSMMNYIDWRCQRNIKVTQHEPNSLRSIQGKGEVGVVVEMSYAELTKNALTECEYAMDNPQSFVSLLHVKHNEYHLEKVLAIWLPQLQAYVGLLFALDKNGQLILQRIILDLGDLKNKASLIAPVPENSWLNHRQMTINRLKLHQGRRQMQIWEYHPAASSNSPQASTPNDYSVPSQQTTLTPPSYHYVHSQHAVKSQRSKPNISINGYY